MGSMIYSVKHFRSLKTILGEMFRSCYLYCVVQRSLDTIFLSKRFATSSNVRKDEARFENPSLLALLHERKIRVISWLLTCIVIYVFVEEVINVKKYFLYIYKMLNCSAYLHSPRWSLYRSIYAARYAAYSTPNDQLHQTQCLVCQ